MSSKSPDGTIREMTNLETGETMTFLEHKGGPRGGTKVRPADARSRDPFVLLYDAKRLREVASNLPDRLFWHFVDTMAIDEFERVYFTAELALVFQTSDQMITRAITKLEKEDRVFRLKRFRLAVNPAIVWRGTPAGRDKAVAALREMGKLP